jgi:hypothetical protein
MRSGRLSKPADVFSFGVMSEYHNSNSLQQQAANCAACGCIFVGCGTPGSNDELATLVIFTSFKACA